MLERCVKNVTIPSVPPDLHLVIASQMVNNNTLTCHDPGAEVTLYLFDVELILAARP